jgi:hypothetical protein
VSGGTPTFYVQAGDCNGRGHDQVFKHVGTGGGAWTRVDDSDGLSGGFGVFAADPNDPDRLYASNLAPGGPQMVFSTDGGTTWNADLELDTKMTGNGAFKYANETGPSCAACAGQNFFGYPQPSLLAFDPEDGNVIVAGGQDSGIFLSADGGANWKLLTDPFNSGASGVPHIPRPRMAYFDHEPAGTVNVYVGSQGFGVWRISETETTSNRPPDCSAAADPRSLWPPDHTFRLISLAGATDPDGDRVTLTITAVTQDEPVKRLDKSGTTPDAKEGAGSNQVFLRAERSAKGDGRVYRVAYEATDGKGGKCVASATVGVPRNRSHGSTAVDSAPPSYDSFAH